MTRLRELIPAWSPEQSDPLYLDRWDIAAYEVLRENFFDARLLGTSLNWARGNDLDTVNANNGLERLQDETDERFRARGRAEPFTRFASGSELSIRSHAIMGSKEVVGVFPQVMSDYSVNIYIATTRQPNKIDTNRATKASDIKSGEPTDILLDSLNEYMNASSRVPIVSQYFVVKPFYRPYNIVASVKYDSAVTSLAGLKARVGAALNKFVIERCLPNQIIVRSDIIHAIEEENGVVEALVTTPGTTRQITQAQYAALIFPTHANPRSGVTNPKPFLRPNPSAALQVEAGQFATAWYCFPDALEENPTDIKVSYTDVAV